MVTTAGIQYKPLSNNLYSIPKAQLLFRPQLSTTFELLGDSDEVTIEPTVEETERFTNEAGIRLLAITIVTQIDANLSMTLVQLSDRNRALSLLGAITPAIQAVDAAVVKNIIAVDTTDKIYQLDGDVNVTITSITDTTPVTPIPYVEGIDYRVDRAAGFVQFINKPAGADADVVITYSRPDILSADNVAKIGIASKTENRGTLIIRGTNEVGPRVMVQLHDVQLRPDGERNFISETDLDTIEVVGRVFRDENQPTGFELGFEQILANTLP